MICSMKITIISTITIIIMIKKSSWFDILLAFSLFSPPWRRFLVSSNTVSAV